MEMVVQGEKISGKTGNPQNVIENQINSKDKSQGKNTGSGLSAHTVRGCSEMKLY